MHCGGCFQPFDRASTAPRVIVAAIRPPWEAAKRVVARSASSRSILTRHVAELAGSRVHPARHAIAAAAGPLSG